MAAKRTTSSVTMQTVANLCGVSKITVSRALSGDLKQVSQETIDRIKAAARELGYNPGVNHAAYRLARKKANQIVTNHSVGLLLPETFYKTNYFHMLFCGALEVLAPKHYALVMAYTYENITAEDLPFIFQRDEIDAFLLCHESSGRRLLDDMFEQYGLHKRPTVSMIFQNPGCSAVVPDHRMAGYLLARHLLSLGHRHIMHFVPGNIPPHHPYALRMVGYQQAYKEMQLDPNIYLQSGLLKNDAYSDVAATVRTLGKHPEVTAVLAPFDDYASRLIGMLAQCGKRVPEDISVVGLDDTDVALNERGENILTTVRMPLREIGHEAAELVLRQASGEEKEDDVTMMLPVKLIERASACPPRS
ncbi:MAG: LacI family DNA-binding transcriptional regulator [Armatimonadota bacterium]|jgi:LacI family transcriptional regulator|nr:hypothetical protein [Armatimonadota bacterium]